MLIKTNKDYSYFLNVYQNKTGKHPTFVERTEAFFCAKDGTLPNWMWW